MSGNTLPFVSTDYRELGKSFRSRFTRCFNASLAWLKKPGAGPSLGHRLTRSPDPTGAPNQPSQAAFKKVSPRVIPGSAQNWIAINAVQQTRLNKKQSKNMTTLHLKKSICRSPWQMRVAFHATLVLCFGFWADRSAFGVVTTRPQLSRRPMFTSKLQCRPGSSFCRGPLRGRLFPTQWEVLCHGRPFL